MGPGFNRLACHNLSGPPGLSIATVHSPPTIYERGQGLGFGLAGLVSRVCMAGLDSRVCMAGLVSRVCPGGTKYGAENRQISRSRHLCML